jgi:hypothetical protein
MSVDHSSCPDHTSQSDKSASEIDARMGGPPSRVKADGTRIYQRPMSDGRTRITVIYPDGSEEVFKAAPANLAKEMESVLQHSFSPFRGLPKRIGDFDEYLSQQAAQQTAKRPVEQGPTSPEDQSRSTLVPSQTERRKKITAAGWLIICAASILNESNSYHWGTPSLSWLVLLCATWALLVWLAPDRCLCLPNWNWRKIASVAAPLIVFGAVIGGFIWLIREGNRLNKEKQNKPEPTLYLNQRLDEILSTRPDQTGR